ncbi:hypothetical protein J2X42_000833 [Arthrobacter sp. BE255]|nr:hypothetical protein [Arthrobacter sp. BE255]
MNGLSRNTSGASDHPSAGNDHSVRAPTDCLSSKQITSSAWEGWRWEDSTEESPAD